MWGYIASMSNPRRRLPASGGKLREGERRHKRRRSGPSSSRSSVAEFHMGACRLHRRIAALFLQKSGSVAIMFALSSLAVILFVGLALDYGRAIASKGVLNTAADAAALAALAAAESDYAKGLPASQMVSDGQAAAQRAFIVNAGSIYANLAQAPTIAVAQTGRTINATINYQANSPNLFGNLAHVSQMTFTGAAAASMTLPSYLSFYLLLDVSESMGIPSTASEISRLAAINPDYLNLYPGGCTIACHFTAYAACQNKQGATVMCQGYNLSRTAGGSGSPVSYCPQPGQSNCIQLRLDAVAYAVQQLISTAQTTATLTNQFAIGLYPFARYMESYQTLTTNLATVTTAASALTSLIDNGNGSSAIGSGGTHFENALPSVNGLISSVGNGASPSSPIPFVFMVTDGAQDSQYQVNNGSWSGSNNATTLNTANCTTIKNRGITLAVLYVPYVPIPNP
ncbi:TadE/TadG family type IV pilus assembly protein, partial [Rhodoblastus sp.]|uniref:TadE/TadG family type IV pilus assembly protein n=2 Tax=Rhodoblastus sp. TaxID=1962975 RepID=UPI003F9D7D5E